MEGFDGVLFCGFGFGEHLVVVEVNEVGRLIVLASLAAFRAIPSKVSYFSALEACVRRIPCGSRVTLEVVLRAVSLISVGILPSSEVISSIVPSVVSSGWCPVSVDIHRDQGVIHPSRGVGRVVLR